MIGVDRILKSREKYFSDIPLSQWDQVAHYFPGKLSLGQKVSLLKDAASEIRHGRLKNE
jgi:hypothetical protein